METMLLPDEATPTDVHISPSTDDLYDKDFAEGVLKYRWTDRESQVIGLCKELWPSALKPEVHKRFVGAYNETIPVTIIRSESEGPTDFILRLPNLWSETPVIQSVAILHYIRTQTQIRVPAIVAYDTSTNNALDSPYIIMERLGGQDLDDLLDDFTAEQRTVIAAELGQLYKQLRQVRSAHSGRIIPASSSHIPFLRPGETLSHMPVAIEPYGARVDEDLTQDKYPTVEIEGTPKDFIATGGLTSDPPNSSLYQTLTRAFDRRIVQQVTWYPRNEGLVERYRTLRRLASTMVSEKHIENPSNDFSLWHPDLFPRNIMVDPTRSPMITGIIDWDEAVFAPAFVAAVAPAWLWEPDARFTEDGEKVEGAEGDEEAFGRSNRVPPTAEMQEVKRVFEQAAGEEYLATCASHYAIIARRIMKFAVSWDWHSWWYDWYDEMLEEWQVLRDGVGSGDDFDNGFENRLEEAVREITEDADDSAWETCSEDEDEDE